MAVVKVCECCKKQFSVPNRRSEQVRFCSLACKTEGRRKTLECVVCKKSFSCEAHVDRKYCSRTCFHTANKGAKHAVDPEQPRYHKVCEVCGKEFRVTLTRKDSARFCSKTCMASSPAFRAEKSEASRGEKHYRWAGGLYKTGDGYIRHKRKALGTETVTFNHREVVLTALIEENPEHPFLVVVDGVKKLSPDIEVHHIDRIRSNNALANLLAVTKHAHAKIHHHGTKPKPWECWPSNPTAW